MKKLLFTFLAVMCCMAMNAQTTFEVDGIKYSVTGENTVEVIANNPIYSGDVVIPSAVTSDGITYDVTGIGEGAFRFCYAMSSVTIPESVTSIGDWAFPSNLNSITVDSENHVYDSRYNCNAIIEKATNTLIAGCKNTIIPSDVTRIGNDAFRACDKLTSVTIPSGVTYIGDAAFFYCDGLIEIDVLATNPPELGTNAFYNVNKNIPVYVPDVETYTGWGGFTNLIKYVDLPTAKEEAIAEINDAMKDITTFTEAEEQSIQLCKENINAATTLIEIKSNKDAALFIIDLRKYKDEAIAEINDAMKDITTFTEAEEQSIQLCKNNINAATTLTEIETTKEAALVIIELRPFKDEAIADLQTYFNAEKIANAPMDEYADRINAATTVIDIPSIVNNIKAEINNYTKFTLGEWKYLLDDNDGEYTIVGGSLTFTDKNLYQSDYDFTANNLTYSRTFTATGVWQAWFVPFDVTVGQMNAAGMEVAQIADVRMGENEQVITAAAKMTNTDAVVKANTPYMVMATQSEVNMTLDGPVVIKKSADAELEEHHITIQSSYNTSKIGGIYHEQSNSDWYALSPDGTFIKINDAVLQAQRLWLTIKPRTDSPYVDPSASSEPFIDANELDYFTTPCTDCPSIEVTKGDKTVKLYNPKKVEFKKE